MTALIESAEPVKADPEVERRENDIAGLRELADWLGSNPDGPLPSLFFNTSARFAPRSPSTRPAWGSSSLTKSGNSRRYLMIALRANTGAQNWAGIFRPTPRPNGLNCNPHGSTATTNFHPAHRSNGVSMNIE